MRITYSFFVVKEEETQGIGISIFPCGRRERIIRESREKYYDMRSIRKIQKPVERGKIEKI